MIVRRINGATRVIGKSQGYLGLPLRDIVISDSVNGPGTPAMESAWEPTPNELMAIKNGRSVILRTLGTIHPPVMLYVDSVSQVDSITAQSVIDTMRKGIEVMRDNATDPQVKKLGDDMLMLVNRFLSGI